MTISDNYIMTYNVQEHFETIKPHLVGVKSKVGTMAVYKNDNIVSLSISLFGEYCDAEVEIMASHLDENSTYLDIGTNIGYHALGIYQRTKCKVIGFEPHPNHFAVATYNTQHLPITLYNAAVSSKKGTLTLADFDIESPGNYGEVKAQDEGFEVNTITIDSLKLPEVTLMKIDVEGHELSVLKGCKKTIERCRPVIFFEANDLEWLDAYKFLDKLEYNFYWVGCRSKPNRPTFIESTENPFGISGVTNILAIPKEDEQPKVLIPVVYKETYNEAGTRYSNYRWLF